MDLSNPTTLVGIVVVIAIVVVAAYLWKTKSGKKGQ